MLGVGSAAAAANAFRVPRSMFFSGRTPTLYNRAIREFWFELGHRVCSKVMRDIVVRHTRVRPYFLLDGSQASNAASTNCIDTVAEIDRQFIREPEQTTSRSTTYSRSINTGSTIVGIVGAGFGFSSLSWHQLHRVHDSTQQAA